MNEIPRRAYIDKMVPAELKIREAMLAVEDMPADVRLTQAVVLLEEARTKVSDYVDGVAASPPAQEQEPIRELRRRYHALEMESDLGAYEKLADPLIKDLFTALTAALPPAHGWHAENVQGKE